MSTQTCQNVQGRTGFVLPANGVTELDVLATAQGTTANDYQEGMSLNGGNVLNLELENPSIGMVTLVGYRRATNGSAWSIFFTDVVLAGATYSTKIPGLGGFAGVRITAEGAGVVDQQVYVSASVSLL